MPRSSTNGATATVEESKDENVTQQKNDVLMIRGKRYSDWPGNINFRKAVIKFGKTYAETPRSDKMRVAQNVVDAVLEIGGRFLLDEGNGNWRVVDNDRALEKAYHALRALSKNLARGSKLFDDDDDDNISVDSTGSAGRRSSKRSTIKTPQSAKRRSKKMRRGASREVEGDDSSAASASVISYVEAADKKDSPSDQDDASAYGNGTPKSTKKQYRSAETPDSTLYKSHAHKSASLTNITENDMLYKLTKFQNDYGHTAVPPDYPDDPRLAEWCSAQRQLKRMADLHQDASKTEKNRLQSLQRDFDFCWDYDEWHWQRHFRALTVKVPLIPKERIDQWLNQQKDLHKRGRVLNERVEKLFNSGYIL